VAANNLAWMYARRDETLDRSLTNDPDQRLTTPTND
jgi:hypothetical protein